MRALLIEVPDEEIVRRLAGRRVCVKNAGHIYHVEFDPPKHEVSAIRRSTFDSSATTTKGGDNPSSSPRSITPRPSL